MPSAASRRGTSRRRFAGRARYLPRRIPLTEIPRASHMKSPARPRGSFSALQLRSLRWEVFDPDIAFCPARTGRSHCGHARLVARSWSAFRADRSLGSPGEPGKGRGSTKKGQFLKCGWKDVIADAKVRDDPRYGQPLVRVVVAVPEPAIHGAIRVEAQSGGETGALLRAHSGCMDLYTNILKELSHSYRRGD